MGSKPHERRVFAALALNGVPIDVLAQRPSTTRGALYDASRGAPGAPADHGRAPVARYPSDELRRPATGARASALAAPVGEPERSMALGTADPDGHPWLFLEPIPLPVGLPERDALAVEVLSGRVDAAPGPWGLAELARVLFLSAGVTRRARLVGGRPIFLRAAASAGALYPIEV
jgi:hypothetical protein